MTEAEPVCSRAIAYLKPELSASEPDATVLPQNQQPVLRDLGNGLVVSYVVDAGDSWTYIQQRHLLEEEIAADDLHIIGCKNLAAIMQDRLKVVPYGPIHAVFLEGNFEASLILVDDLWAVHLSDLAPNGFIAALPARDILAFADAASEAGIAELRNVLARAKGADHPLSGSLFRKERLGWVEA